MIESLLGELKEYENLIKIFYIDYGNNLEELDAAIRLEAAKKTQRIFRMGERIFNKVDDFIKSGKLKTAQRKWCDDSCDSIRELSIIEGIGEIRAAELVDAGIYKVEDLYYHTDILSRQQIIGLEHYHDLKLKIPRDEVQHIANILQQQVEKLRPDIKVMLCGSFRRGAQECRSISILLESSTAIDLMSVLKSLKKAGVLVDIFCKGELKFSCVCRSTPDSPVRRQLVRVVTPKQTPFSLLNLTGPSDFWEELTRKAIAKGFCIDEYSMHRMNDNGSIGAVVTVDSEEGIFELLSLPYLSPEDRSLEKLKQLPISSAIQSNEGFSR